MSNYNPSYNKKDFMALQVGWVKCYTDYLDAETLGERLTIIDDWRDSLVDVKPDGKLALRSTYENWEENDWLKDCKTKLVSWKNNNVFESRDPDEVKREFNDIKQERNYLRFRQIMQVIQNSGIGLGAGVTKRPAVDRRGYIDG